MTNGAATARQLVSVDDICRATGLAPETVRHHLDAGEWPGVRIGRRRCWRCPAEVIDALLAGRDPGELRQEAGHGAS
jgi:hypothetical protein